MLKLAATAPEAQRLDLPGGAFLLVRPATLLDHEMCVAAALAARADIEAGASLAEMYRLPVDLTALADDRHGLIGLAETILIAELGARLIVEAGGIVMPDGSPFPLGDRGAAALLFLDAAIARKFKTVAEARIHEVTVEAKKSGPSSTGAAAGASITAPDAAPSKPTAPAASGG